MLAADRQRIRQPLPVQRLRRAHDAAREDGNELDSSIDLRSERRCSSSGTLFAGARIETPPLNSYLSRTDGGGQLGASLIPARSSGSQDVGCQVVEIRQRLTLGNFHGRLEPRSGPGPDLVELPLLGQPAFAE
jgi:hypothetical protein